VLGCLFGSEKGSGEERKEMTKIYVKKKLLLKEKWA